jgi:maltose/moltooligosaccharide transporter
MEKPRQNFWQMWNMSFGFLGIQFGWGLQMANMSAIYEKLGANPELIPILWLAAPMTGLLVQPIVGALSDRTWGRLGRRRPYFLVGAICASVALFFMPTSPALWVAASLLWILDASVNVSMEPFRAFVADKLHPTQRTSGYVMQAFFIGLGASLANALPFVLSLLGVSGATDSGIPLTVKYSFQIGALVFLSAVLWTVISTKEYPPEDMEAFRRMKAERKGLGLGLMVRDIISAAREMPTTMRQLAVVQVFTWLGLFSMWMFFVPATARHVFGATDPQSELYTRGIEWGGMAFALYSVTCFIVAFALPVFARLTSRKIVHAVALTCGGVGLLSMYVIQDPYILLLTMVGVGIAWASILAMPYAILSNSIPPARMGVYMGLFNAFIVLPQVAASLGFGPAIRIILGEGNPNTPLYVVMFGGLCMLMAAVAVAWVHDVDAIPGPTLEEAVPSGEKPTSGVAGVDPAAAGSA